MAMNVGGDADDDIVATINTTTLVDVMLVLLIIFLITIPVVTKTVPLELPKVTNQPRQTKPENINRKQANRNDRRSTQAKQLAAKNDMALMFQPMPKAPGAKSPFMVRDYTGGNQTAAATFLAAAGVA